MRDEPTATYVREAVDYRPVLMAGALRMTRNPADAEDLVQETYLRPTRAATASRATTCGR